MPPSEPSLSRPYRWLAEALQLCRAHLALFLVAASTMLLIALLPSLLPRIAASVLPGTLAVQVGTYVLFSVLLLPPVTGGFFRLAHDAQRGLPTRPMQIFAVLADGPASARLVLVNLVFLLLLVLGVIMPVAAIGGQPLAEWLRQIMTLAPGAKTFPPMPPGTGPLFGIALLATLLLNTAKELAMAQAALGNRPPLEAVADGFRVALRHSAAFLLFYVPMAILAFLGFMLVALVAVMVGAVLSLVAAPLAYLVIMPVAVAIGLGYYALVFAFFYRAWRDTLAPGDDATTAPPPAPHGIEL
jgi:hypothetical protein